jgi:hypothetical protein
VLTRRARIVGSVALVAALASIVAAASVSSGSEGENRPSGVALAESLGLRRIPASNLDGHDVDCGMGAEVAEGIVYCLDPALPEKSDPTYRAELMKLAGELRGEPFLSDPDPAP